MTTRRKERAAVLAARREGLVAQAQLQRDRLAIDWQGLHTPLRWVERGWQAWAYVRARPWAVLLPVAALLVLRPRWAGRATAAVATLTRVGRWLR